MELEGFFRAALKESEWHHGQVQMGEPPFDGRFKRDIEMYLASETEDDYSGPNLEQLFVRAVFFDENYKVKALATRNGGIYVSKHYVKDCQKKGQAGREGLARFLGSLMRPLHGDCAPPALG